MGPAAREHAPAVVALLRDPDSEVHGAAVRALGTMKSAAKEQIPAVAALLQDGDPSVREAAAGALGKMGAAAEEQIPALGVLLQDPDSSVRRVAASALGALGPVAREQAPAMVMLLQEPAVRWNATKALEGMGPLNINDIVKVLSPVYDDAQQAGTLRFLAHFVGGGDKEAEIAIQWLGRPERYPEKVTHADGITTLQVFEKIWAPTLPLPRLHEDLEKQIAVVAKQVNWGARDLPLLRSHAANLVDIGSVHVGAVQGVVNSLEREQWYRIIGKTWLVHVLFWLALIFAYPRSSQVQAIFFWNPWVRRTIGLGYIGFALTWVPYLRNKLFAPFKESLLADAQLESFNPQEYFAESAVQLKTSNVTQPIRDAISAIRGQIILEGESGLGKTMFLRDMLQHSKHLAVYLPADKCAEGVIEAIQAKLHGPARDRKFLRNLIYSGTIDICIDGLNEATADTRAKVNEFVESYFKGNILIATQPLEWTPPATAKIYIMQPLRRNQIERFLLVHLQNLPEDAVVSGKDYEQASQSYLAEVLDEQQPAEIFDSAKRILSNPMDLTVIAQMLAYVQKPDLFGLQEQQYTVMAADYKRVNVGQEFPLTPFSEAVYQMRLQGEVALPEETFLKELQCMARKKMVVIRHARDAQEKPTKAWVFRHDKIMEFFIVQTFLGARNERPLEHLGDPRFRGVYFLLAMLLPLDEAEALRELLINYAADTKDHTVSDPFIQLLRSRKETSGHSTPLP
jgi:hypothetical protein